MFHLVSGNVVSIMLHL